MKPIGSTRELVRYAWVDFGFVAGVFGDERDLFAQECWGEFFVCDDLHIGTHDFSRLLIETLRVPLWVQVLEIRGDSKK